MTRSDSHNNGGRFAAVPALPAEGPPDLDLDELPAAAAAESEALAELFLGDSTPTRRVPAPRVPQVPLARSTPASPGIEGLVLGHLPVLASAWVQQYARHVASELHGPVALLRLRANEATLELVSGSGVIHQPTDHAATSLASALAAAAREAAILLIRTDETTEPRLAELAGLDTLTLLSGADEAATVASYRTIKNLTAGMDDESHQPTIRLAIMGASPAQAADASARIERAASAFLDRQIRVTACISKIGGGKSTPLYKGPLPQPIETVLRSLRQMFVPSAPRHAPSPPVRPITAQPERAPRLPVAPALPETEPPAIPEPVVSRIGHLPASQPSRATQPAPTRLCDHIAGLTHSPLTCPYAPVVEFALGADGLLHLLAHLESPTGLADLLTAAAWARSHRILLRQVLVKGPQAENWTAEPVLHLFTGDAVATRHLADAALRIHLLAEIHAAGQSTWFSTPLN